MEQTKEQLQKEIMEILYAKSLVKPVWITCSEVYWNIQNIKVTERSVREALDWLVKNEVVLYQGDKYQINKREFIEMSKRKAMEEKEMNENISPQPEKTGINENKTEIRDTSTESTITVRKNYLFYVIIALIAFLLSGITYRHTMLQSLCSEGRYHPTYHREARQPLYTGNENQCHGLYQG